MRQKIKPTAWMVYTILGINYHVRFVIFQCNFPCAKRECSFVDMQALLHDFWGIFKHCLALERVLYHQASFFQSSILSSSDSSRKVAISIFSSTTTGVISKNTFCHVLKRDAKNPLVDALSAPSSTASEIGEAGSEVACPRRRWLTSPDDDDSKGSWLGLLAAPPAAMFCWFADARGGLRQKLWTHRKIPVYPHILARRMGKRLAASPMWSMKWEHSTRRKYTTSCWRFNDLCKVILRSPTPRGRFL